LEELHLAKNRFHGTVPDSIDTATNLHALDLTGNPRLEGYVPFMGPGYQEEAKRLMETEDDSDTDFVDEMAASLDVAVEPNEDVEMPRDVDL
jgi:hypothetical protein